MSRPHTLSSNIVLFFLLTIRSSRSRSLIRIAARHFRRDAEWELDTIALHRRTSSLANFGELIVLFVILIHVRFVPGTIRGTSEMMYVEAVSSSERSGTESTYACCIFL